MVKSIGTILRTFGCFGLLASAEDMLKMLVKARTNIKETTVKRLWEKAMINLFSYISGAEIFHRLQIVLRYLSNVSTISDGGIKFTHVGTCQKYGTQKRSGDPRAQHVLRLMTEYLSLRVAYIDKVKEPRKDASYLKIKLPRPAILGEGKPENHNHAIIFTRGKGLQTIDMNQKEDEIFVCQKKYAADLLKRFHMSNCIVEATPMNPSEKLQLNDGTRKAYAKFFRSLNLKKQQTLALSSSKAEYTTVTSAAGQALWSKQGVDDVGTFDHLAMDVSNPTGCVIAPSKQVNIIEILWDDLNLPSLARIAYFLGMCIGPFGSKQGVDDVGAFDHLDMDVMYNLDKGDKDGQDSIVEILGEKIMAAYNVADDIGLGDTTVDDNNGVDNIVADTNIHGDNNVLGDTIEVDNNEANRNMDKGKGPSIKEHIFLEQKTLDKGKGIMIEGEIVVNKKKKHVFRGSGVVIRENENPSMDNDSESDTNNYDVYHKFDAIESDSEEYDRKEKVTAKCDQRKEKLKDATKGKQRGSKKYPSCRSIIALDGCFYNKPNSGEILTVVGRDGNNHIYPMAWAIVIVENRVDWSWFLESLGEDLRNTNWVLLKQSRMLCLMKSIASVLDTVTKDFVSSTVEYNSDKSPKVPGKAGRPEKKLVDVADEVVVLEFVSNEINEFHRVGSSNHVVFNNDSMIDLGSNWNKNKRGAKCTSTVTSNGCSKNVAGLTPLLRPTIETKIGDRHTRSRIQDKQGPS
ncbi:callose synthase 3 [Tanacetum coccineum]